MEAAAKIAEAGSQILDMTSAKWKDATSAARAASKAALQRCTFIAKNTAVKVVSIPATSTLLADSSLKRWLETC